MSLLRSFSITCTLCREVAPQCYYSAALPDFGGVTDWYQSQGYRELGHFQNLDYNRFSKILKIFSPLSDIRARMLPDSLYALFCISTSITWVTSI